MSFLGSVFVWPGGGGDVSSILTVGDVQSSADTCVGWGAGAGTLDLAAQLWLSRCSEESL